MPTQGDTVIICWIMGRAQQSEYKKFRRLFDVPWRDWELIILDVCTNPGDSKSAGTLREHSCCSSAGVTISSFNAVERLKADTEKKFYRGTRDTKDLNIQLVIENKRIYRVLHLRQKSTPMAVYVAASHDHTTSAVAHPGVTRLDEIKWPNVFATHCTEEAVIYNAVVYAFWCIRPS